MTNLKLFKIYLLLPLFSLFILIYWQPAMARDYALTFGAKSWFVVKNQSFESYYTSSGVESQKSDVGILYGANLSLVKNKFLTGLSVLNGTYNYQDYYDEQGDDYQEGRFEIDAYTGYLFHPRFAPILGIRYFKYEANTELDEKSIAGAVGFTANVPVYKINTVFYTTISALIFSGYIGESFEIGASYNFSNVPISILATFKLQNITFLENSDVRDLYYGSSLGISYSLR